MILRDERIVLALLFWEDRKKILLQVTVDGEHSINKNTTFHNIYAAVAVGEQIWWRFSHSKSPKSSYFFCGGGWFPL